MSKDMVKFYQIIDEEYTEVIKRFMYNESIYRMCVEDFINDDCVDEIRRCYYNGDREGVFQNCHALKGVAINLGFTRFFKLVVSITEIYRQAEGECSEKEIVKLNEEYTNLCTNIKDYLYA